jgi:hypothetical protein
MRRPPVSVFIACAVLLSAGAAMVLAALLNLALVRAVGPMVAAATIGGPSTLAAWHLYGGHRLAWMAAIGLLPVVGAAVVFDTYVFGTGRVPVSGLLVLAVAWVCLVLPSTRAFVKA